MTESMTPVRTTPRAPSGAMKRHLVTAILAIVALSLGTVGGVAARGSVAVDPDDPRLTPNPVESSDQGTLWTCRVTGSDIACSGSLSISWELQEGPDFCAVPLLSLDGIFSRTQTRFYTFDAASGLYLEYKRLIHLDSIEEFTPAPDPSSTNVVNAGLSMTWISTFQSPGDLNSRSTRKQGIDTFIKAPHGGVIVLDIGQKTEDLTTAPGEDFNFRGRWDIALGDPAVEFGKICAALGL